MTATVKTETVTFRIRPDVKAALRDAAEREHRSLANMREVMIRAYLAPAEPAGAMQGADTGGSARR